MLLFIAIYVGLVKLVFTFRLYTGIRQYYFYATYRIRQYNSGYYSLLTIVFVLYY